MQESKQSVIKLAKKYSLHPLTIYKWKRRDSVYDGVSGGDRSSRSLTPLEEKIICEFRRVTKYSLDDCFISLKAHIPKLSRSNLHRTLKRHNLNVLPKISDERVKKKFKDYHVGYVHMDISNIIINKKKYYLFVAIDRITKFTHIHLYDKQSIENSKIFLKEVIKAFPFKIHTILTDNGVQFTYKLLSEHLRPKTREHPFDIICDEHNINHKLTQFRHPWTNGQVEIMNKTLKDNTTKKYHYDNIEQLKDHMNSYIYYYNYERKLKSLSFKSPYDRIKKEYEDNPQYFYTKSVYKLEELNN